MNETPIHELTCAQFSSGVGTVFQVSDGSNEAIPLKLVEVKERAPRPGEIVQPGMRFTLLFTGPKTMLLPQRLYWFTHETMGRFELFIVPVAQNSTSFSYEAVFNRIAPD